MKKEISNIDVLHSSKVIAIVYFLISAFFFIPMSILAALGHHDSQAWSWLVFPFIYLIIIYLVSILTFLIYNFVAKYTGGISVDLDEK